MDKPGFSHVSLVQVPEDGGIGTVVRHAEHHAFHLATELSWDVKCAAGAGINEFQRLRLFR